MMTTWPKAMQPTPKWRQDEVERRGSYAICYARLRPGLGLYSRGSTPREAYKRACAARRLFARGVDIALVKMYAREWWLTPGEERAIAQTAPRVRVVIKDTHTGTPEGLAIITSTNNDKVAFILAKDYGSKSYRLRFHPYFLDEYLDNPDYLDAIAEATRMLATFARQTRRGNVVAR
jgi:hypothetical protein